MTSQTPQPLVSAVSAQSGTDSTVKASASARRRAYEALATTDSDMTFMAMMMQMMNAPAPEETDMTFGVEKKGSAEKPTPDSKKEKPVAKIAEPELVKPVQTADASDPIKSQHKETDMLTVDGSTWAASDIKTLMNWVQNPPAAPINTAMLPNGVTSSTPNGAFKTYEASMAMQAALRKAYQGQRPLRVNLDNDAHVILRFARDGKVSAEFVASGQASDMLYRQQLSELRTRLESKQLAYGELTVRRERRDPSQDDPSQTS